MAILIQDTLTTIPAGGASFTSSGSLRAACRLQSMPSAIMVRKDTYADWVALSPPPRNRSLGS